MGGLISGIKTLMTGDPLDGISKIIQDFKLPPDAKAQLQVQLDQLSIQKQQLSDARDQALLSAEATAQNDPAWKKAHAWFIYIMDFAIGMNLIIFPLVAMLKHGTPTLLPIPSDYLWLFGATFGLFTGAIHGSSLITAMKGGANGK